MVIPHYPFNIKKFPTDEDILLTEDDLHRKNVVYCRKEILEQMKCTQWAKEEYLLSGLDPEKHNEWFHYHLNKCYTPYMDAIGCMFAITDREIQKMKKEAGAEGWKTIESWFVNDTAKTTGENNAKMMWDLTNNLKQAHESARQRDGPLFGERPKSNNDSERAPRTIRPRPLNLAEALGVNDAVALQKNSSGNGPATKRSHLEVEDMFAVAKEEEMKERQQRQDPQRSRSFWGFGS